MSDKTVDEIMKDVRDLAIARTDRLQQIHVLDIEAAITALAAERDLAVKDSLALKQVLEIAQNDFDACVRRNFGLARERDALQARVVELEKAVLDTWREFGDDWHGCHHCNGKHADLMVNFQHTPDCIVRTIEGKTP